MNKPTDDALRAISELLELLQDELIVASETLPSTRCLSLTQLKPIIKAAQARLSAPVFRRHSAVKIVELLNGSGLLTPIPLEQRASKKLPDLFAIGFNLPALPSAFEVLQAFRPNGVLCYFSALELHGLTTQVAPHYHVATFRSNVHESETAIFAASDKTHSLGSPAFAYQGVDCYVTTRDRRNLLAVQRRQLNSQSIARVTSLEQTLLDCLHRPASAGGAPVVFEAWAVGTQRVRPNLLWKILSDIDDVRLYRRAGYMLEINAGDPSLLLKIKERSDLDDTLHPPDALLPGIPYTNINNNWRLRTA